jgi:hypothetical protein
VKRIYYRILPHKSDKGVQLTIGAERNKTGRWWKIPLEVLAVLSAILGVIGFAVSTQTKLSVEVSGSSQAANPLATIFYVSNDGALPVHSVMAACGAIQFTAGNFKWTSEPNARLISSDSKAETLSPGHKMSLPCNHMIGVADPATITKAEMTIIVDYQTVFRWQRTDRFPLKAERTENGWIWKSIPR